MHQFIFTITLLLFSMPITAQHNFEFAPIGAEWHYEIKNFLGQIIGYELVRSHRDTMVEDKSCKILERVWGYRHGEFSLNPIIICQTGNLIEHWVEEEFYTLYDFDAKVGDSWIVKLLDGGYQSQFEDGTASVYVDSVSYRIIQNRAQKVMNVSLKYDQGFDGSQYAVGWSIREISSVLGSIDFIVPHLAQDYPDAWELNCYTDETWTYKNPSISTECNQIVSAKEFSEPEAVNLYPNPSSGLLYISMAKKSLAITIYDIYGKEVNVAQPLTKDGLLDVSSLKSGLYLLRATDESMNSFSKLFTVL